LKPDNRSSGIENYRPRLNPISRLQDYPILDFKISQIQIQIPNPTNPMKQEELSERLWNFAARIGKIVDALPDTRLGRHVAGQLVRCGTSAPPNYDESGAAESRDDFVHKLSIALKELRESRGWLKFIVKAELLPIGRLTDLIDESEQLCRILGKSILTAKSGRRR